MWFWLILLIIILLFGWLYYKYFKIPKMKNVVFIDGSLGTGKSALTVCLAIRMYKRHLRYYKFKKFIYKLFKIKKECEEPLLYSNIHLRNIKYTYLTNDLILRKNYRFAYKSIVILDEFSLVADQNMYGKKYEEICERMNEFFKLFRHETKGGYLFINSQSTSDLNYTLKSVLSDYFYIHHKSNRFVPFICCLKVQECRYSRDNSSLNVNIEDVEENLKTLVMLKKWFKYYDTYCHSIYTDYLPIYANDVLKTKKDSLKSGVLVSYKDLDYLYENVKFDDNNNVIIPDVVYPEEIKIEVKESAKEN